MMAEIGLRSGGNETRSSATWTPTGSGSRRARSRTSRRRSRPPEQHRLVRSERELLEATLKGAVDALMDTLGTAQAGLFSRAGRLRRLVGNLCEQLDVPDAWRAVAHPSAQLRADHGPAGAHPHRGPSQSARSPVVDDHRRAPDLSGAPHRTGRSNHDGPVNTSGGVRGPWSPYSGSTVSTTRASRCPGGTSHRVAGNPRSSVPAPSRHVAG
jgi:hypothetical protein